MRGMVISPASLWPARLAAFILAGAAAASAVYWGLQVQGVQLQAPLVSVDGAPAASVDPVAVARALGATARVVSEPAVDVGMAVRARLVLTGIVATRKGAGAALIAVDGKPAKPFAVGTTVVDSWVLRAVQARSVTVSQGGADVALEMPPQAALLLQK